MQLPERSLKTAGVPVTLDVAGSSPVAPATLKQILMGRICPSIERLLQNKNSRFRCEFFSRTENVLFGE